MISSISAENPYIGLSNYSMTNAAIDNLVKVAEVELINRKIRVNSVRSCIILTRMIANERAYTPAFMA
mgnify:CR=1 FL=1